MSVFGFESVMIRHPDDLQKVINNERDVIFDSMAPIIGEESLLCLRGDRWKRQRHQLDIAFKKSFLKGLMPSMVEIGDVLLTRLELKAAQGNAPTGFKVDPEFVRVAVAVIGEACLGSRFGYAVQLDQCSLLR
jgi:cytochrome P450